MSNIKTNANKDVERSGFQSERTFGKTMMKTGAFIKNKSEKSLIKNGSLVHSPPTSTNFRQRFLNKEMPNSQEVKEVAAKTIKPIGKTSIYAGNIIRETGTVSRSIDESLDGTDTSGGINFVKKNTERIERKVAFKTAKLGSQKGLEYTKQGTKSVYHKLDSTLASRSKTYNSFKSTTNKAYQSLKSVKPAMKKVLINSVKQSLKMTKAMLAKLVLPMLSSAGAVISVLVICVILGAGSGSSITPVEGEPNFTNTEAWITENPYSQAGFYGQCTWFAWGRFYEIYGYSPGFLGDGNQCVWQLLETHPDKFVFSKTPIPGAVGSSDFNHNHVFIVTDVKGDMITIQDGNMNGVTDTWEVAITDWRKATFSAEQLQSFLGDIVYANPLVRESEENVEWKNSF